MDLSLIKDFFGVVGKMMVMSEAPRHRAPQDRAPPNHDAAAHFA